ncbi:GNAT family N-acetyltransferase [Peribacillus kribbensis]|uniref:GNAT family N-acetyltransferase n=1 Tax=Peribacillus kribbensis TaxID=356658 RepID=UPI00047C19A5|nr:GNAT family protein [Peribacillus kribbensis]
MELRGHHIFLRFLEYRDAEALLDMHKRNSEWFQKYSPTFDNDYYTLETKRKYISDSIKQREEDKSYSFGIFLKDHGILIGDVSLFRVARGPLQRCLLGYSLDEEYNGRGFTTEAVSIAVDYAFNRLKLHRIEAGVMLSNPGSMRVLEKAGFQREGIEKKGVKINGQWEDHQIFALLSDTN